MTLYEFNYKRFETMLEEDNKPKVYEEVGEYFKYKHMSNFELIKYVEKIHSDEYSLPLVYSYRDEFSGEIPNKPFSDNWVYS